MEVRITRNDLSKLAASLAGDVDALLNTVAHSVEGEWKDGVRVDTGNLKSSIHTVKVDDGYSVETNVDYSPHEEFGTRHMRGSHAAANAAVQGQKDLDQGVKGLIR